jgi:hypothetical protein
MLAYEEYLAPVRPKEALAALRDMVGAKGWTIEEDRSDGFFCLEEKVWVRQEPRKLLVAVEDFRTQSKVCLVAWCSGFSLRRYDGRLELMKDLPFECTRLAKGGNTTDPAAVSPAATSGGRPSWVRQTRLEEFGLLALSFAAMVFFVIAVAYGLPLWSVWVSVAVAAVSSLLSGLALDFLMRRTLKIESREGMKTQLRRAGMSAVVAIFLLYFVWQM